ncbi:MAG: phage virion morphogenesis protein, partial [Gammaproteobacteria bacterium]
MAGASLKLQITVDDRSIRAALERLVKASGDLRPVFAEIGEYLDLATRERFDREQAPDGTPWEPLSDATLRRKMLKGVKRGRKRRRLTARDGSTRAGAIQRLAQASILVESGALRDTLRYRASADSLEFGTDRKYGATHQFGDEKRNIPARPFLGLSDADRAEIVAALERHLR